VFLFEDLSCTDCHRFYHLGDLGDGPDLTGYMSRDWLTGIIKNPEHERFYGSSNDGMPAHFESEDDHLMTSKKKSTPSSTTSAEPGTTLHQSPVIRDRIPTVRFDRHLEIGRHIPFDFGVNGIGVPVSYWCHSSSSAKTSTT
jgi:hypothetical protein